MDNSRNKILLIVLIVIILLIGCRPPEKPDIDDDIEEQEYVQEDTEIDERMYDEIEEEKDNNLVYRAETIADSVVNIPGIDDATAIIKDNTAIVAVEVGDITDGNLTDDLKSQIIDIVKRTDYEIKNVLLTSDRNLFERIDNLEQRMMRGESIDKLNSEINNIIKQIS